ncbi:MAG: PQQ-dependent sugar dehydrogenase [Chloroflexota bacterium]
MVLSVRLPVAAFAALLLAVGSVLFVAAMSSAATPAVNGDANCDGTVNANDALTALLHESGVPLADEGCAQAGGDTNCDSFVDGEDALAILEYVGDPSGLDEDSTCTNIDEPFGTVTPTPENSGSETPTPDDSETPTITPTLTPTATPSETPTPTPTATPSPSPTPTPTLTPAPLCGTLANVTGGDATPVIQGDAIPQGVGAPPQSGNYVMTQLPANAHADKMDGVYPVPGDPSLAIVTTETGMIYSICLYNQRNATLVGDFTDVVRDFHGANDSDEGLLGFAFQPGDPTHLYINYSTPPDPASPSSPAVYGTSPSANGVHNHIAGFTIVNGVIDRSSEKTILDVYQPWEWHNVEGLLFGPDGYLYIGSGDGGSSPTKGQSIDDLYGAILRIAVQPGVAGYTIPSDNPFVASPTTAAKEMWAYGTRNPWRLAFDSATGKMWFADAGEKTYEEVDLGVKGANYGWAIMEGDTCYSSGATPPPTCDQTGLSTPQATYKHSVGCVITGGQVYHGAAMPELNGYFIYGDFCSGRIWGLNTNDPGSAPILLINPISGTGQLHPVAWAITSTGDIIMVDYTRANSVFTGAAGIYVLQRKP